MRGWLEGGPRRPRLGRSPQGLFLGLVLLATVGVVLTSEKGSRWLAGQVGYSSQDPAQSREGAAAATAMIDWAEAGETAAGYLQTYVRFDTSRQSGQGEQAAQWLHGVLSQAGIESYLLPGTRGRPSVLARLPGQGHARPLLLYSHIDLSTPDTGRWSVPPFEGTRRDGFLYGAGAVDPKGQTIANLMTLLVLQRLDLPLQRDVIFLAVGSEETLGAPAEPFSTQIDGLQPEFLLGSGGGNIELQPGQRGWMVSTFTKGYLSLRLGPARTASDSGNALPADAGEQLLRAVDALLAWQTPILPSRTTNEFFRRIAWQYPFPLRDLLAHPRVWPRLVAPQLLQNPAAADSVRDTVRLVRLEPWPDDPLCPSAVLTVHMMPGRTRSQVLAELQAVPQGASMRFQLLGQADGQESAWDTALSGAIEAVARRQNPQACVLPAGDWAPGSRHFRSRGVVCYGFLSFGLEREEWERIGQADERLSLQGLQQGVRLLVEIVLEACAS